MENFESSFGKFLCLVWNFCGKKWHGYYYCT